MEPVTAALSADVSEEYAVAALLMPTAWFVAVTLYVIVTPELLCSPLSTSSSFSSTSRRALSTDVTTMSELLTLPEVKPALMEVAIASMNDF